MRGAASSGLTPAGMRARLRSDSTQPAGERGSDVRKDDRPYKTIKPLPRGPGPPLPSPFVGRHHVLPVAAVAGDAARLRTPNPTRSTEQRTSRQPFARGQTPNWGHVHGEIRNAPGPCRSLRARWPDSWCLQREAGQQKSEPASRKGNHDSSCRARGSHSHIHWWQCPPCQPRPTASSTCAHTKQ